MEPFGIVIVAVVLVSLAFGLWSARTPVQWDDYNRGMLDPHALHDEHAAPPSTAEDEADLRALIERKRAARGAPPRRAPSGPAWGHIEPELLEEARELITRRALRHERQGKPPLDPVEELTRLLGPPHR